MPSYRSITVHVTDRFDQPLKEYSILANSNRNTSTCYIEAVTDMAFRISIVPEPALISDRGATGRGRLTNNYPLLATLRLDGKQKYEKRTIIHLSRDEPGFRRPDGKCIMKYRNVRDADGFLRECGWYFKEEGGIDDMFSKLFIATSNLDGRGEAIPASGTNGLITAFGTLGANGMADTEEPAFAGQITITLEPVTLGIYHDDVQYVPEAEADDSNYNIPASTDTNKISHTSARDAGQQKADSVSLIEFELLPTQDNQPYAKFTFFYRKAEVLRKMGFLGSPLPPFAARETKREKRLRELAVARPLQKKQRQEGKEGVLFGSTPEDGGQVQNTYYDDGGDEVL